MASDKKYWKSEAELLPENPMIETLKQNEFAKPIPVDDFLGDKESLEGSQTTRRDFLKYVGFSTAAATMAACEGPVHKSVPYVVQPEHIVPGIANYYATAIADGFDFANIVVKTREGRPIKIENNDRATSFAGANARVNASVLSLYDSKRVQTPMKGGTPISWSELDKDVKAALEKAKSTGKKVVLLSQTYASPTTDKLLAEFATRQVNFSHVVYDAISEEAAVKAYQTMFGERAMADYDFSKADLIVSFDADFLGDWQGGGYDSGYAKGRVPSNGKMSRHIQIESNLSLSGANADKRIPMKASDAKVLLAKLYGKLNGTKVSGGDANIDKLAGDLAKEISKIGSNAVVVSGINDEKVQQVILAINKQLQSKALDAESPRYVRQGNQTAVNKLIEDMNASMVGVIIIDGVNPSYSLSNAARFVEGLKKVEASVYFTTHNDETAQSVTHIAASNHFLENWGDVQMKKGHYSLMQPVIRELFNTKQLQTCLLSWMGSETPYRDYLKTNWKTSILGTSSWTKALQDGVFTMPLTSTVGIEEDPQGEVENIPLNDLSSALTALGTQSKSGFELHLYTKTGMGDGKMANNPWLQEFPDPITRISWDNYLTVSEKDANELGIALPVSNKFGRARYDADGGLNGAYATLTVGNQTLSKVPVVVQPGQAQGTLGLAFGYGRTFGVQEEMQTGVNAFSLYLNSEKIQSVSIAAAEGVHEFACIQMHQTLMGRGDIIKETTLEIFNTKDASEWNHIPVVSLDHQEVPATSVDLWESFDRSIGHHFNMSIDLNACTGCGACVIACHAENNVPVVGKEEVRKSRDMHWLRIDRYYSSETTFEGDNEKKENMDGLFGDAGSLGSFGEMENPAANPQVAFQPVMCQHCNHAPCETVCPVAATAHSRQGQNHMAYNRCVGTRYCANNCPYKVRRFNWFLYNNNDEFDYHMNNDLGKMVINPDVNVRSRGVMEKCSMCIQMTQKSILEAKKAGRPVKDEEFQTACSSACNSGAIVFGDINDKESKVAALKEDKRMYHLLEHVGTQPNVFYHVKVRNTNEA